MIFKGLNNLSARNLEIGQKIREISNVRQPVSRNSNANKESLYNSENTGRSEKYRRFEMRCRNKSAREPEELGAVIPHVVIREGSAGN